MNYLLDRKSKKRKYTKWAIFIIVVLFVAYFSTSIFRGLSVGGYAIFRPVLFVGNSIGGKIGGLSAYFASKNNLVEENESLKYELDSLYSKIANYNTLSSENEQLKEVLGRMGETSTFILSAILAKPNQSLYDTLVIDRGSDHGIEVGDKVFALGNVPMGRVAEVYGSTSKVILFSSAGEITDAVIAGQEIFIQAVGRGGGNFEILLPRDLSIPVGTEVTLPGLNPKVVGIISAVISEPRDALQKVLMVSPVNIFELKFVQVEI